MALKSKPCSDAETNCRARAVWDRGTQEGPSQLVDDLIGVFDCLSTVHRQASIPNPDLRALRAAQTPFVDLDQSFDYEGTPAPCRFRLVL
jgi:hypothetical protein